MLVLLFLLGGCFLVEGPVAGPENPGENREPEEDPAEEDPAEDEGRREEEWRRRNEELKEELGEFFVSLPHPDRPDNPPVKVRGLYLTGHTVGGERYAEILEMIEETELNAVVIDVKDDHGKMTYRSEIEIVNRVDAHYKPVPIKDIRATLEDLHQRGIYTIARIVVFKDPYLASQKPDWAIQRKEGGVWTEKGVAWINPYQEEVWDYNIAIAKEAALLGFREIQFDYIRFPENAARVDREAWYPGQEGRTKDEAIAAFLDRAVKALADYNVYVAADTFGVIATSWGDQDRIGQIWETFAEKVDYQCPMIYPSHYGPGYFGFPVPDAEPVGTVTRALTDALKRNAPLENPAIIRPWLQSFTATWIRGHIPYGAAEVRRQIDAALALGIEEYMLWSAVNRYPRGAFLTAEEADRRAAELREKRREKGHDFLNRTAREAGEIYLEALKERDWREAYALERTVPRLDGNTYRDRLNAAPGRVKSWEITGTEETAHSVILKLTVTVTLKGEDHLLEGERWILAQENNLWRIKPSARFLKLLAGTAAEERGQE